MAGMEGLWGKWITQTQTLTTTTCYVLGLLSWTSHRHNIPPIPALTTIGQKVRERQYGGALRWRGYFHEFLATYHPPSSLDGDPVLGGILGIGRGECAWTSMGWEFLG
eukprot:2756480-Amphidinium_carterae.1